MLLQALQHKCSNQDDGQKGKRGLPALGGGGGRQGEAGRRPALPLQQRAARHDPPQLMVADGQAAQRWGAGVSGSAQNKRWAYSDARGDVSRRVNAPMPQAALGVLPLLPPLPPATHAPSAAFAPGARLYYSRNRYHTEGELPGVRALCYRQLHHAFCCHLPGLARCHLPGAVKECNPQTGGRLLFFLMAAISRHHSSASSG